MYLYSFESGKCQSERSSSTADLVYWNTTPTKIIILRLSFCQEIKTKPQVSDKTKVYVCLCQQLKPPQVTGLWGSHHQTLFQVARLLFLKPLELALCGHAEQSCSLWAVDIYSSHWTLIWLEYLPANWAEAHFMGITKLLSVIMELGWNSHWWFSWKRSHLNILNHHSPQLICSEITRGWSGTSALPAGPASFHASPLDNRRLLLISQRMQLSVLSLLSEELIQRANSSLPPLG